MNRLASDESRNACRRLTSSPPPLKIAVAARFVLTPSIPLFNFWRAGRSPDQGERMVFSSLYGALLKITSDTALPCPLVTIPSIRKNRV
jgi:hypothetical protein